MFETCTWQASGSLTGSALRAFHLVKSIHCEIKNGWKATGATPIQELHDKNRLRSRHRFAEYHQYSKHPLVLTGTLNGQ